MAGNWFSCAELELVPPPRHPLPSPSHIGFSRPYSFGGLFWLAVNVCQCVVGWGVITQQPHNTITQQNHTTQSHNTITQHYHTTLSHNTIIQHNHSTLSHNTVTQHCHTTQSHNIITQHCHTTLSHNTVTKHCHTRHTQHYHTTLLHNTITRSKLPLHVSSLCNSWRSNGLLGGGGSGHLFMFPVYCCYCRLKAFTIFYLSRISDNISSRQQQRDNIRKISDNATSDNFLAS